MHNDFMRGELLRLSTIGRANRMQRHVAGKAQSFKSGVELAAELIDSGKALDTLNRFVEVSNA